MKPIKFDEQNSSLLKPGNWASEDCGQLPVCKTGLDIVSCWKMSWRERIAGLFFGKVWISIRAGRTHPPISVSCEKTIFEGDEWKISFK